MDLTSINLATTTVSRRLCAGLIAQPFPKVHHAFHNHGRNQRSLAAMQLTNLINIENNLLLDDEDVLRKRATFRLQPSEDPEFAEYYFNVLVDEEIDLCRSIDKIKQRMPNYDIKLKCPDAKELTATNISSIYGSDITEEDCESCKV